MQYEIPEFVKKVYQTFIEKDYEIYLVGGSVRNLLMNIPVKDWDFTTNATPEEILTLFPDAFYDNQFGTVGIPHEVDGQPKVIEVTTFRTETTYSDTRHPDTVEWGKTIQEDLSRRDFTINAIALNLSNSSFTDPYEGKKDIDAKLIRAVGDASQRFKEDALRLMRAIRIATELSFVIEEDTWKEIVNDAELIQKVSGERIRLELLRILASDHAYEGIMLLKNSGILGYILPELLEGVGVSQARPGRHHTEDVFNHNVLSLKYTPSKDPVVRFAALLHDVGKPRSKSSDEQGLVIFYNHEVTGAKIAREICDRLHFSKKDRDKIVNLIRWHMFTVDEHITDSAIRRFIRRVGVENVKDMMDLRIGDRLGGGTQTAESWRLKKFKQRVEEQLKPAPFSITDLAIDGNDIMKELTIQPSKKVGEILQNLFEYVDEDLSRNTREYLLKKIKEIEV